jgi:mutator protein MutT
LRLIPVALALFYRLKPERTLEVWTQVREDDGIYHGLLEFPGGGIEANETPLVAAVREVSEEVGIMISPSEAQFMGTYSITHPGKTILLNVFLFPDQDSLFGKGQWLEITSEKLSSPYLGKIPGPNHQIIDDLFRSLYS